MGFFDGLIGSSSSSSSQSADTRNADQRSVFGEGIGSTAFDSNVNQASGGGVSLQRSTAGDIAITQQFVSLAPEVAAALGQQAAVFAEETRRLGEAGFGAGTSQLRIASDLAGEALDTNERLSLAVLSQSGDALDAAKELTDKAFGSTNDALARVTGIAENQDRALSETLIRAAVVVLVALSAATVAPLIFKGR